MTGVQTCALPISELMRGLGKGVKEFKGGMKEAEKEFDDIKKDVVDDKK